MRNCSLHTAGTIPSPLRFTRRRGLCAEENYYAGRITVGNPRSDCRRRRYLLADASALTRKSPPDWRAFFYIPQRSGLKRMQPATACERDRRSVCAATFQTDLCIDSTAIPLTSPAHSGAMIDDRVRILCSGCSKPFRLRAASIVDGHQAECPNCYRMVTFLSDSQHPAIRRAMLAARQIRNGVVDLKH